MNPKLIREYIREQSFPKAESHEEVKVLLNELAELERLVEIGRATGLYFTCQMFLKDEKITTISYQFQFC